MTNIYPSRLYGICKSGRMIYVTHDQTAVIGFLRKLSKSKLAKVEIFEQNLMERPKVWKRMDIRQSTEPSIATTKEAQYGQEEGLDRTDAGGGGERTASDAPTPADRGDGIQPDGTEAACIGTGLQGQTGGAPDKEGAIDECAG